MFPIGIKGEFNIPQLQTQDVSSVLIGIERELAKAQATNIRRKGDKVLFRGGIFRFVTTWNVLGPVWYGEIEVISGNPSIVRYKLSCVEMLVMATLMVILFVHFVYGSERGTQDTLLFSIALWFWLYGMNYLIAAVRLPRFIRKAVTKKYPYTWN